MENKLPLVEILRETGQAASFAELDGLVEKFEQALACHGVKVKQGGSLEAAMVIVK